MVLTFGIHSRILDFICCVSLWIPCSISMHSSYSSDRESLKCWKVSSCKVDSFPLHVKQTLKYMQIAGSVWGHWKRYCQIIFIFLLMCIRSFGNSSPYLQSSSPIMTLPQNHIYHFFFFWGATAFLFARKHAKRERCTNCSKL